MSRNSPLLYGRAREIDALFASVTAGTGRVVKITGISGVGKTALARAVAELLSVERGSPALWASLPTPSEEICRTVGDRAVLVVLDGDDTGRLCGEVLADLIRRCPRASVLVTSCTAHGVAADHHVRVAPLPVHGDDAPARELLLAAVFRADPYFRTSTENSTQISEICRLLDGIPRALEAAASWFPLASPAGLLRMAREEPLLLTMPPLDAQRTNWLRDAVCRAVASLSPAQARLLDEVSGWDRPWTVAEVTGRTAADRLETGRAVRALLTCGLIGTVPPADRGPARFAVLGLVRNARAAQSRLIHISWPAQGIPAAVPHEQHQRV